MKAASARALLVLVTGLSVTAQTFAGSTTSASPGAMQRLRLSPAAPLHWKRVREEMNKGMGWLAQHMQWDFDDIDPTLPISPFWRFDHQIQSPVLLPGGHDSIRFSTTVRPTGRRGWVTTTINPFAWLQMQSTLVSRGLGLPLVAASGEAKLNSMPLVSAGVDAMTHQVDDGINFCLDGMQQGLLGRTVAGNVNTHVLVGAGSHEEPWVGVESTALVSLSERGRPLRLRARVACDRELHLRYTASLS